MLALAVEGALMQAYDPGYDGPVVAAFSKFEADGLFDGLVLSDGGLIFISPFVTING